MCELYYKVNLTLTVTRRTKETKLHLGGQGHRFFDFELSSRSRTVLEDPIPVSRF